MNGIVGHTLVGKMVGNKSHLFLPEVTTTEMAVAIALAIITTIGNLLVIVAVYKDPYKELRTVCNYLVVNLAVADLIMGLISEPLFAIRYWLTDDGSKYYKAVAVLRTLAVEASCFTVLFLTIERYIVLEMPLRQERLFSGVAVKIYIFLIWLSALAVSLLIIPFWNYQGYRLFLFDGIGFFLLLFMLGLYIRMFLIIRKFNKALLVRGVQQPLIQPGQAFLAARKREQEVTKAIFLFYGTFALCWLPSIIAETITYKWPIDEHIRCGLLFLGLLNSALNPVLYALRMPRFRRAVKKMFDDFKLEHAPIF